MAQAHDHLSDAVSMEALVRHQLILLGEDPSREGLRFATTCGGLMQRAIGVIDGD